MTIFKKGDKLLTSFMIIGIILTSFAWIGDIVSWSWLGNGFLLDIILAIIAIFLTIGTLYLYQKYKQLEEETPVKNITKQHRTQFTCFNCGAIIESKSEVCSKCGSPRAVCVVCYSPLYPNEEIVKLPCCSNYGHKDHISNYLQIKGHCPKCQQKIQEENLVEVTFK